VDHQLNDGRKPDNRRAPAEGAGVTASADDGAIRDDTDRHRAPDKDQRDRTTPSDLGHGTPGGSLGALNEDDTEDPEATAEKSEVSEPG